MKCSMIKWLISNALDSGKDFPAMVKRHLASCSSCRTFAAVSDEIGIALSQDVGKATPPAAIFSRQESHVRLHSPGRVGFAVAVAACVLIAVATMVLRNSQPQSIDNVTAVAEEIARDYAPAPALAAQIDQFQGEIVAVERDIEDMKELLIASTHLVSDETIADILF